MPIPYPKEFRPDVVAVARQGDQSIAKVARSFGISESCLSRWLRIADREDAGLTASSTRSAPPPAKQRRVLTTIAGAARGADEHSRDWREAIGDNFLPIAGHLAAEPA